MGQPHVVGEEGVEVGGQNTSQTAANIREATENTVVVDGKMKDMVEELR